MRLTTKVLGLVIGPVVAISVLAFILFIPAFNYNRVGTAVIRYGCGQGCDETLNANYSAQVSLSYLLLKCGVVQNAVVSYFNAGVRQTGQLGSIGGWFCGTLD